MDLQSVADYPEHPLITKYHRKLLLRLVFTALLKTISSWNDDTPHSMLLQAVRE